MQHDVYPPRVSVILPVHRVDQFFTAAVDSILSQSYTDFELLIIANGCSDSEVNFITQNYADNQQVNIVCTEMKGLSFALNLGTHLAKGIYIARMDADDISSSDRLAKQAAELDNDPDLGIVSSCYSYIDASGQVTGQAEFPALNHAQHLKLLPFLCCVAHPTVMIRKCILQQLGGYSFGRYSEDYDLWLRVLRECPDTKFLRLPNKLLSYRRHGNQATSRSNMKTIRIFNATLKIREFLFSKRISFLFGIIIPARISIRLLARQS